MNASNELKMLSYFKELMNISNSNFIDSGRILKLSIVQNAEYYP
jgi:hypothetical protein